MNEEQSDHRPVHPWWQQHKGRCWRRHARQDYCLSEPEFEEDPLEWPSETTDENGEEGNSRRFVSYNWSSATQCPTTKVYLVFIIIGQTDPLGWLRTRDVRRFLPLSNFLSIAYKPNITFSQYHISFSPQNCFL